MLLACKTFYSSRLGSPQHHTSESVEPGCGRDDYAEFILPKTKSGKTNIIQEQGSKPRSFWACDHTEDCTFPEADCPGKDSCPKSVPNPPWADTLTDEQVCSHVSTLVQPSWCH